MISKSLRIIILIVYCIFYEHLEKNMNEHKEKNGSDKRILL